MSRNARIGVLAGAVVVIVAALVIVLATSGGSSAPDTATASITVDGIGRAAGGPKHITVKKGGSVDLTVTTAIADEVHVHGYDIATEAEAGKPVPLRFPAALGGVFEGGVDKPTDNQIAELEVRP